MPSPTKESFGHQQDFNFMRWQNGKEWSKNAQFQLAPHQLLGNQ
jgi:hypothetical protein